PVAVVPAPEARPAAPPAPAPAAAPAPAPTQAAAPAPTAAAIKAAPNGAWLVQLGALREEQAAVKEWLRLQKAHPDLLSSLNQDIQRADLGDKGLFFRLRAGPLDEQAARNLCTQLSGRKVGCLVVKK
ncbi:SPOR domain-containing protein, partial [Telmatospirillum sp. J64-1]|uniref:SPOR domain-containing protein n=1 Tax=Telmatospirillum sp. J64-1 TaxID=2502183 RepID=UPI00115D5661